MNPHSTTPSQLSSPNQHSTPLNLMTRSPPSLHSPSFSSFVIVSCKHVMRYNYDKKLTTHDALALAIHTKRICTFCTKEKNHRKKKRDEGNCFHTKSKREKKVWVIVNLTKAEVGLRNDFFFCGSAVEQEKSISTTLAKIEATPRKKRYQRETNGGPLFRRNKIASFVISFMNSSTEPQWTFSARFFFKQKSKLLRVTFYGSWWWERKYNE